MSDIYAVEVGRRPGRRFDVVTVDVYQRGAGRRADDICHLRAHHVVAPRGVGDEIVDALIASSLLQLQAQAAGEVLSLVDPLTAPPADPPSPERAGKAVGMTAVTALRIAEADAAFAEHFSNALREQVELARGELVAEPDVEELR